VRPADTLLAKLVGVKATGKGRWVACCPAHEDRSPSLSVREMDDGRLLVYDFGGCHTHDVLAAVGLSLGDLYEVRLGHFLPPIRGGFSADELLLTLEHETFVVLEIIEVAQNAPLTELGIKRLELAAKRICKIRSLAYRR
jgi:hypothetical protein